MEMSESRRDLFSSSFGIDDVKKKLTTRLERKLAVTVVILSVLLILLFIILIIKFAINTSPTNNDTHDRLEKNDCQSSEECIKISMQMTSFLDTSINPCDDFYSFSCNGWIEKNPIQSTGLEISKPWLSQRVINNDLKEILKNTTIKENSSIAGQKVFKMYRHCVDKRRESDKYDYGKLIREVNGIFGNGGWPIVSDDWVKNENFDLNEKISIVIKLNKLAIKGRILNFITRSVHQRPSMLRVKDVIGIIGNIGDLIYDSNEDERGIAYKTLFKEMIKEVYKKEIDDKDVEEIMDFEREISQTFLDDQTSSTSESVMTMNSKYGQVNWIQVLKDIGVDSSKIDLANERDRVFLLNNPSAFNSSLYLMERTDEKLFKNYLGWRYFLFLAPFTSLNLRSLVFRFDNLTYQVEEQADVSEQCMTHIGSFMPFAIGKLYLDFYFSNETVGSKDLLIHEVTKIINELKASFFSMIDSNKWMDWETKMNAFKKLNDMKHELFFPSFLEDDKKLDDFYDGLHFNDGDYMSNVIEMYRWLSDKSFQEFRVLQQLHSWDQRSPIEVNAFYSISFNTINVPIGAIAGPFFDLKQPTVLNYGSFGAILGHEITHGFDTLGRRYDSIGQETDWWTEASKNSFLNRSDCFINQYERFKVGEVPLRGNQVLDETIADAGGLTEAFKVSEVKNGPSRFPEIEVRGRKLTRNQIFFTSFAQTFCSNQRPSYAPNLLSGSHPPNKFRVIGSLQDSDDFARVFECPIGSFMNPEEKCRVW